MAAAFSAGGVKQRVDLHLDAGCDVVLVCHPELVEESLDAIKDRKLNTMALTGLIGRGAMGWDGLIADAATASAQPPGRTGVMADSRPARAANSDLIHDRATLERAIAGMAARIHNDYAGSVPVYITVMHGGLPFAGSCAWSWARAARTVEFEYLHATRYRGATSGGELTWKHRPARRCRAAACCWSTTSSTKATPGRDPRLVHAAGRRDVRIAALAVKKHDRCVPACPRTMRRRSAGPLRLRLRHGLPRAGPRSACHLCVEGLTGFIGQRCAVRTSGHGHVRRRLDRSTKSHERHRTGDHRRHRPVQARRTRRMPKRTSRSRTTARCPDRFAWACWTAIASPSSRAMARAIRCRRTRSTTAPTSRH
jgi:hypothetical protein